jgi:hypothetical protein
MTYEELIKEILDSMEVKVWITPESGVACRYKEKTDEEIAEYKKKFENIKPESDKPTWFTKLIEQQRKEIMDEYNKRNSDD